MKNLRFVLMFGVALAIVALIARKRPGENDGGATRAAAPVAAAHEWDAKDLEGIARRFPGAEIVALPSGLRYIVLAEGEGGTPRRGQTVTAHYTGSLLDGKVFDSSAGRRPFEFAVGTGRVIPGWDEAFMGMKKGEKRVLIIPHWLGYGERGAGDDIPGGAALVFEVEVLGIR
ncbi:MAG: FKBP-type peptidyl-prolyl cis-trans isomerase [Opitutaceae bacterium]|nr:FKBP-type peptidyl-prolyl cis-trans isomerase [Opitutaceae bacterium]